MHKIHAQPGFFLPDSAKGTQKSLKMTSLGLKPDEMLSEGQDMRECVRASGEGGFAVGWRGVTVGTGAKLVFHSLERNSCSCSLSRCLPPHSCPLGPNSMLPRHKSCICSCSRCCCDLCRDGFDFLHSLFDHLDHLGHHLSAFP